jgi:hypothetical protein
MKKKIIVLLIILICITGLLSQTKEDKETANAARRIKLAGDQYWWDEKTVSKTWMIKNPQQREILRQGLKLGICNNIKSYVQGSIVVNDTETDGYSTSRSQRSVMVSSNLYLKNIGYYEFQKDKKQYIIFAYLKRSDFLAQEDEVIARINILAAEARNMESELQSGYLLPYYRAYLMSYNITRCFKGNSGEEDMQLWLENKLYSILRATRISSTIAVGSSSRDKPLELLLDCPATHSGLLIELPGLGFNQLTVVEGKCKLFYPGQPSRQIEEQQIHIMIDPALVAAEPEIAELAKRRPITVPKTIKLDFSSLFSIDFIYCIEDMKASFKPSYGDISIKSMVWDLGDGTQSRSMETFEHQYAEPGTYRVHLLVNGEYPVVKELIIRSLREPEAFTLNTHEQRVMPNIELRVPNPEIGLPSSVAIAPSHDADPTNAKPTETNDPSGMELLNFIKVQELICYLESQKTERKLTWGKLTRASSLDRAWVVISEQDGTIIAILQPQSCGFIDLLSKKQIDDVFATYHGKAAIYISYF